MNISGNDRAKPWPTSLKAQKFFIVKARFRTEFETSDYVISVDSNLQKSCPSKWRYKQEQSLLAVISSTVIIDVSLSFKFFERCLIVLSDWLFRTLHFLSKLHLVWTQLFSSRWYSKTRNIICSNEWTIFNSAYPLKSAH